MTSNIQIIKYIFMPLENKVKIQLYCEDFLAEYLAKQLSNLEHTTKRNERSKKHTNMFKSQFQSKVKLRNWLIKINTLTSTSEVTLGAQR